MTKVTFHNQHNPDEIWTEEAAKSNIGRVLPLTNQITGEVGEAKILDVEVDAKGITVTYETDMNFGIRMDGFSIEIPYEEGDDDES